MQSFTRLTIPLVLIAGLFTPQALANESGGPDPTVSEQGPKIKKKTSDCDDLAKLARELAKAKLNATDLRGKLARARDILADLKESTAEGSRFQRLRRAQEAVDDATEAYKDALEDRDEKQRAYDKLRRSCS